MITPKDLQVEYQNWVTSHNGKPPTSLTMHPDTWNFLTQPDPNAVNPAPQPKEWMGVPVILDPNYQLDAYLYQ